MLLRSLWLLLWLLLWPMRCGALAGQWTPSARFSWCVYRAIRYEHRKIRFRILHVRDRPRKHPTLHAVLIMAPNLLTDSAPQTKAHGERRPTTDRRRRSHAALFAVPSSARDAPSLCCWPPAYESGRLLFYGGAREISGYSASRHSWPCVSASAQLGR